MSQARLTFGDYSLPYLRSEDRDANYEEGKYSNGSSSMAYSTLHSDQEAHNTERHRVER